MDLRMFAACLIMTVFLIKHSDAQVTAWAVSYGASSTATMTGTVPDQSTSFSIAESTTAGTTLFTVTATATGGGVGYTFVTADGNPDSTADAPTAGGAVLLATGKSFDYESTTKSYIFKIVAAETNDATKTGTVTVTLSITDTVEFTKRAFCLASSSVTSGASVGTLATDQTSTTYTASAGTDSASFTIDTTTGAITAATALAATTKTSYLFTTTGAATDVETSPATDIYVLINCSCDSGAAQVAALFSMLLLSVVTALFN